jgi:FkbM family methyltransferase
MEKFEWMAMLSQWFSHTLGRNLQMKKIHRAGVDIGIAFSSGVKRMAVSAPRLSPTETDITSESPSNTASDPRAAVPVPISLRARIKGALRKVARYAYRSIKPVFRPIAFRTRHYITDGLRHEIQQEIQRASAATVQDIRQEIQRVSAATVQELQAARESLWQALQIQNDALVPRLDRIEQYSGAAARRVAVNCNDGEVLVRTEVGYVICAANDHSLLSVLIDNGDLEVGTRLLIQKFLKPGDFFVDVGANVGMHTLAAGRAMQGQGKIIAFEPFESTKRMLEKSLSMNGFSSIAEVHQAAVSNVSGYQSLYLGAGSGLHSLFPQDAPRNVSQVTVEVPLVRLDEIIPPGQKIDLLKIDAEGAELDVIQGGVSLISGNPDIALIVEFGPSHLCRTGHTPKEWFEAFTRLGFNYRVINASSGVLENCSVEQLEQVYSVNLFFAREDSQAWRRLVK